MLFLCENAYPGYPSKTLTEIQACGFISIVVKSGRSRAKSSLVHAIFERFFERNSLSKNGRTNGIAVLTTPTAHAHSGGGGGGAAH